MLSTTIPMRSYTELSKYSSFLDRFEYLRLDGTVGSETFGSNRFMNQAFYTSPEWRRARREVIIRDDGCDLGVEGYDIFSKILIHHMNPIREEDLLNRNPDILNPEFLICVSHNTHNAIHYGDKNLLPAPLVERKPGDTCPWK